MRLSRNSINKLRKTIRTVEGIGFEPSETDNYFSSTEGFLGRLTSTYSSGYSYNFIEVNDSAGLTAQADWGGDANTGQKIYHIGGCQSLQSGEYVWVFANNMFKLIDLSPRRVFTGGAITAGAGDGSTYGTGSISGYGTVRNYYSSAIDTGTLIYVVLVGANWEVLTANCA